MNKSILAATAASALVFAGLAVARFWAIPQDEGKLMQDWRRRKHDG